MSDEEIDYEALKRSFKAVDITDDPAWLAAARWEVAAGYSKLANPKHKVRMRDIYATLCTDGYEDNDRSRTIAVLAAYPSARQMEIAGLVRIVFGRAQKSPNDLLPLDAMHFIEPVDGWPHRRRGINDDQVAELGRFTVSDSFRSAPMREASVDTRVTRMLFDEARRIATPRGIQTIYSIMPPPASEISLRAGVGLLDVPIRLRDEDPEAAKVFEAFNVYWRRMTPHLYEMTESAQNIIAHFEAAGLKHAMRFDEAEISKTYNRNVTALQRRIPLIVLPMDESEVERIISVANENKIPIYPFSTGKNWGLGSKLPVADDCVIVDLSRMSRIVRVDENFAYAVLEPGVTQLQLASYLNEHHPSLTMNFTGSFAYTGVVGNVLDRGDGAHARVDDLLGVRGFLGNGKPFAVGGFWENVESDRPSHVLRYTAGPDLCGMFCQSSFGVVTQLAFKLIPKPESRYIIWGAAGDESLEKLVDAMEGFAAQGLINRGGSNIGYANRFVQAQQTLVGGTEPPVEWNWYALASGTKRVAKAIVEEMREALSPLCTTSGAFHIGAAAGDHDAIDTLPPFLQPLASPLFGLPDASTIKMIYQLTGTPLPADDRDVDADQTPFGMKTCIPIVPPKSPYARQAAGIVAEVRRKHAMNVKASFFGDGRTLITVHFRSDIADQVKRATACENELWDRLLAAGFGCYRASIDQMPRLVASRPEYFRMVSDLKAALDPNGIISPGRYAPSR